MCTSRRGTQYKYIRVIYLIVATEKYYTHIIRLLIFYTLRHKLQKMAPNNIKTAPFFDDKCFPVVISTYLFFF